MTGDDVNDRSGPMFGMGRGRVFPAAGAGSLLHPLRRVVQSPVRTVLAIDPAADARVLEIGAGPGYFSPALADAVPRGRLIVLDLQREMVELARARTDSLANAALAQADAVSLPFALGAFDVVVIAIVLGEVPDTNACIAEARRVLTTGGRLAVAETRRDSDFVPISRLRRLVEPHGFEFDGRRGPRWQYVARFRAG